MRHKFVIGKRTLRKREDDLCPVETGCYIQPSASLSLHFAACLFISLNIDSSWLFKEARHPSNHQLRVRVSGLWCRGECRNCVKASAPSHTHTFCTIHTLLLHAHTDNLIVTPSQLLWNFSFSSSFCGTLSLSLSGLFLILLPLAYTRTRSSCSCTYSGSQLYGIAKLCHSYMHSICFIYIYGQSERANRTIRMYVRFIK